MVLEIITSNIRNELNQLSVDTNEFLKNQLTPENWQKTIELYESINVDVDNVIKTSESQIRSVFDNTIKTFGEKMSVFSTILLEGLQGDISKTLESDRYAYSRAVSAIEKNYLEIGRERSLKILEILQRWMDCSMIISVNLIRNMGHLSSALQKIDSEELEKSSYGTLFSLACIFRIFYDVDKDTKKLDLLIKIGDEYSEILESYSDTIDILCSNEETKMINYIDNR